MLMGDARLLVCIKFVVGNSDLWVMAICVEVSMFVTFMVITYANVEIRFVLRRILGIISGIWFTKGATL